MEPGGWSSRPFAALSARALRCSASHVSPRTPAPRSAVVRTSISSLTPTTDGCGRSVGRTRDGRWSPCRFRSVRMPSRAFRAPLRGYARRSGIENGILSREQPLVERFSDTSWTTQRVAPANAPDETLSGLLSGVSCTSATSCVAVGWSGDAGPALVEAWNGLSWVAQPTSARVCPHRSSCLSSPLSGVSCSSPVACTAVGYAVDRPRTYTAPWRCASRRAPGRRRWCPIRPSLGTGAS